MPTLLEKGKIIKQKWMNTDLLNSLTTVEFIVDFISKITSTESLPAKTLITGPGSRVLILRSGTGSGKSTVLPVKLYEEFKGNVLISQPTRATAVEIPHQIAGVYSDFKIGKNLGYQTGIISRKSSGLMFVTTGILLQYLKILKDEEFCKRFRFILVDEAHKRSLEFDNSIILLKKLLERNYNKNNCPVVIFMSGTLNTEMLLPFFETKNFIDVMGQTFKVKMNFSGVDISDTVSACFAKIKEIHETTPTGQNEDIITFLSGQDQIKQVSELCEQYNKSAEKKIAAIGVLSHQMSYASDEYRLLFGPLEKYSRRCILGSNALETGITIDTLAHCIDSGIVKEKIFGSDFEVDFLIEKPCNRASVLQRKGRVGRKKEGNFYALYTENTFKQMESDPYPSVITENINDFLLSLILQESGAELAEYTDEKEGIEVWYNKHQQRYYYLKTTAKFVLAKLQLPTNPSSNSLQVALRKLFTLGCIDCNFQPTILGYYCDKMREIKLESKRMILASYHENASTNCVLTIAVMLNYARELKNRLIRDRDDLIDYLLLYRNYIDEIDDAKWPIKNKVSIETMHKIVLQRDQLINDMLTIGMNPWFGQKEETGFDAIKRCIAYGYGDFKFKYFHGKFTNEKIMLFSEKKTDTIIVCNLAFINGQFTGDSVSLIN